jgi:hypothetical protein
MCKVKIHLFELSAVFGFPVPAQTVLSSQKNNILFQPKGNAASHAVRRPGFNTSEFEAVTRAERIRRLRNPNCAACLRASQRDPEMLALRENEQEDCSLSASLQRERQWWQCRPTLRSAPSPKSSPPQRRSASAGLRWCSALVRRDHERNCHDQKQNLGTHEGAIGMMAQRWRHPVGSKAPALQLVWTCCVSCDEPRLCPLALRPALRCPITSRPHLGRCERQADRRPAGPSSRLEFGCL